MPLDCDGQAWNGLNHYDDDAIISHNDKNYNISSLRVSSPFKGYGEKSHAIGTRKETRELGAVKERGISSIPSLSRLRGSLASSLATPNGEVAPRP